MLRAVSFSEVVLAGCSFSEIGCVAHSFTRFDWFLPPFHEFDENQQLDHEINYNKLIFSLTNAFHSYVIKAYRPHFLGVYSAINPLGMLGEHSESL